VGSWWPVCGLLLTGGVASSRLSVGTRSTIDGGV
jgi:hypothetical protein